MYRYKLTAFYEDAKSEARVAQLVIVIAETDQQAVAAAKEAVANDAIGGRIAALKVLEKAPVQPGVVHRSDPYIPFQWPGQRPLPKVTDPSQAQA
jgi:hypothetical protein